MSMILVTYMELSFLYIHRMLYMKKWGDEMSVVIPRVPASCPPGFLGRYTVSPGDTMFRIAQMFRVRLEALAVNNPHIANPNVLYPGDVLCVPARLPMPC
jgi:hypothetical protein